MKRYKDDIGKIKASDEIKQQTVLMMQKNLQSKKVSYRRNFRLAFAASLVLFVSTTILSAALINQRSNGDDIAFEAQDQMMKMESYEMSDQPSEGMSAKSMEMQAPEFEPMMMVESETENLIDEQDRIICGEIILIDEAFIDVDGIKVYTDNYTYYKGDIVVGSNVEVLVYYIDNVPYADWIELSEN